MVTSTSGTTRIALVALSLASLLLAACEPRAGSEPPATVASPSATPPPQVEVTITYVGNDGFLVATGGRKILVDALHRYGLSASSLELLESARPPFDGIDLILTTHSDYDHFDPLVVGTHLENDPQAVFVSTADVVGRVRAQFAGFDGIRGRVQAVQLERGESAQATISGIDLQAINLPHGPSGPPNLGFLIEVGGVTLLHTGDLVAEDVTTSYLQDYGLPEARIDVAFIPWFYLAEEAYRGLLQEGIGAGQIVAMHLDLATPDRLDRIRAGFPGAIVFERKMDERAISLTP
jgi:L-ascorbate metabolism protein UlaG (beta-lactamase superfamily)